jgi:M6 family metalloprotease-like protein
MPEKQKYWMPCGFWRVAFFAVIFILAINVQAAPHRGDVFELKQPDNSRVSVHVWGDEYYQRVESMDGYSLIRNEYGWICYADVSQDGSEFIATEIVYEGIPLDQMPLIRQYLQENRGLKKGLKINPASRLAKALKHRKQLNQSKTDLMLAAPGQAAEIEAAESAAVSAPLLGSIVGLTILIDFPDEPAAIPVAEVDNYCNQVGYAGYSNNGSVRDYFYDVSNGLVEYTNIVVGYYRALHDKTYYNDISRPYGEASRELLGEALDWLDDQGFDFTQLSITSYNAILATNLFYAGNPDVGWAEGLWPHASGYYGFTTSSGITSGSYQISNLGSSLRLGTFCHENGHMICNYPDLYDYGYESNGIGDYGLMAGGGSSLNPVPPNPYLRDLKGWETIIEINTDAAGTIRNHQANGFTTYRYSHPTNPKEFFMVESRLQSGRNASIPDEGLLIWHIDEAGSNDNEQMTPEKHYKVSVEQADGLFGLETGASYGSSGDLFHADYRDVFNDTTLPDAKWWDGSNSGLDISGISEVGAALSFVLYAQETYPPTAYAQELMLTAADPVAIELTASDDGIPGPLVYSITSLPQHGRLFDPNYGEITAVPHPLPNDANSVVYQPCSYYFVGTDDFSFKANDGGVAPEGGDSNIASVTLTIDITQETQTWTYTATPQTQTSTMFLFYMYPGYSNQCRMQCIYPASLIGAPTRIQSVGLELTQFPSAPLQNWTIRMKHSAQADYANTAFDNEGFSTVYSAVETIAATGWKIFTLQTPFDYNGTDPLMIDFSFNNSGAVVGYNGTARAKTEPTYQILRKTGKDTSGPLTWATADAREKLLPHLKVEGGALFDVLVSDFNINCRVGIEDLIAMIDAWLSQSGDGNYDAVFDISQTKDEKINLEDFTVLASEWLQTLP